MRPQSAKETRPLMSGENRQYLAYMLRLWQVNTTGGPVWRASLEDPHTGNRSGFSDLASLFAFLEDELGQSVSGDQHIAGGEE